MFRALATDRSVDATWLDARERDAITSHLSEEQGDMSKVVDYWDVVKSANVIIVAVQYARWSVGVYGFIFWLPTIIKAGSDHGIGTTGLLSSVPYALAVVMTAVSYIADRTARRRVFVGLFLLVGTGAFYAPYATGAGDFGLK